MTVWILMHGDYDEHQPHGVFASEASAWEVAARFANGEWDRAIRAMTTSNERARIVNTLARHFDPTPPEEVARRSCRDFLSSVEVTAWDVEP